MNYKKPPPLLVIIIFSAVLWGTEYASRSLWDPDETRYAYVAKEMWQNGHWAVPHRYGIPYTHKPPLMFWLIQFSARLTYNDINRISTRLPSLAGVILTLWSISRIASMWTGPATIWLALPILATTPIFWKTSGMGQIDALLCGLQSLALYFMFSAQATQKSYKRILAFVFMGLAILAKGPVGFLIPIGIYIAVNVVAGNYEAIKGKYWIWGTLITILFPVTWLIAAWIEGAPVSYFKELLWSQNIDRAAGEWGHVRPFYYYLLQCPVDFLPWTLVLPVSFLLLYKQDESKILAKKCITWALFVIVFFSISASKRNLYVLMAYPPLAIIIAEAYKYKHLLPSYIPLMMSIAYAVLTGFAIYLKIKLPYPEISFYLIYPVLILAITSIGLLYLYFMPSRRTQWLIWIICMSLILEITIAGVIYPELNNIKTPAKEAELITNLTQPSQKLILYRTNTEIVPLYAKRQAIRVDDEKELWEELYRQKRGVFVSETPKWKQLEQRFGHIMEPHYFQSGSKDLVWCFFDVTRQK